MQAYTSWVADLARFHRRSPDRLGQPEMRVWVLHLITERKLSASTVNIAINALRAFYSGMLGQDLEPMLVGIKRPRRHFEPSRVLSTEEVERLLTFAAERSVGHSTRFSTFNRWVMYSV